MMKRVGLVLAALLLAAALAACSSHANPPGDASGTVTTAPATKPQPRPDPEGVQTCGDYLFTVTDGQATLVKYTGEGGDLVIPAELDGFPVAAFGKMLFANNAAITSVTVPGSVSDTGMFTFFGCTGLKTVTLESGVSTVGMGSFDSCTALESVNLESVSVIRSAAFQGCTSLKAVTFAENVTLELKAFAESGLESVVVPAGAQVTENSVFYHCDNLKTAEWNAPGLIRAEMFALCVSLTELNINGEVTELQSSALMRCEKLESLILPASVAKLRNHCFFGCTALKELYILNPSLEKVEEYVGRFLPALTDVYFAGTEEHWNSGVTWDRMNEMLREATLHPGYNIDASAD